MGHTLLPSMVHSWVEAALHQTMARYVQSLIFLLCFISQCPFCFFRGVDWIIEKVDDEECDDVDFKTDLVMQDIRPIGGLCRVVLGTIMNQQWVPLEFKALLFCFSTDRVEDEVHHAFCRFSCNRNINIFQM